MTVDLRDTTPKPPTRARSALDLLRPSRARARRLRALGEPRPSRAAPAASSLSAIFSQPPASIAEVVSRTRAGDWVPGERAWALELAGKAYGYLIAVPITCGLYSVAWVLQRPTRLGLCVLVTFVLWLAR